MKRDDMADLTAFVAVAEHRSFTRAATQLGLSQSALSQIVRRLEARLGVRLLARTTRSVAPTAAGEALVAQLSPMLRDIDESIAQLSASRGELAGSVRVTAVEHAAKTILVPALAGMLAEHPEIEVEIFVDYGLTNIVTERFDAGVRLGESVEKDMISVPISADIPMAVVGSPGYFRSHAPPTKPEGLVEHRCINLRLPTSDTLNTWRFERGKRGLRVKTKGPLTFNSIDLILDAALRGVGLAYLPLDQVLGHIDAGALIRVLDKATTDLPAYHLYYPSRRHTSAAFRLFVDAVRRKPRKRSSR